jgi:hypothetical protein
MLAVIGFALGLISVGLALAGTMFAILSFVVAITPTELATSGGTIGGLILGMFAVILVVGGLWLLVSGALGLARR